MFGYTPTSVKKKVQTITNVNATAQYNERIVVHHVYIQIGTISSTVFNIDLSTDFNEKDEIPWCSCPYETDSGSRLRSWDLDTLLASAPLHALDPAHSPVQVSGPHEPPHFHFLPNLGICPFTMPYDAI